jgi:3-demethoxyubiquinol 3-hydroxylase
MKKKPSRNKPRTTTCARLPGDRALGDTVARMIRVDHAGEFGAQRIYAGQLAVLGESTPGNVIRRMARQEDEHLAAFEKLIVEKRVRPTALHPVWHVAGYVLGAATAKLGDGLYRRDRGNHRRALQKAA